MIEIIEFVVWRTSLQVVRSPLCLKSLFAIGLQADATRQVLHDGGSAGSRGGGMFEPCAAIDCMEGEAHCPRERSSSCTAEQVSLRYTAGKLACQGGVSLVMSTCGAACWEGKFAYLEKLQFGEMLLTYPSALSHRYLSTNYGGSLL